MTVVDTNFLVDLEASRGGAGAAMERLLRDTEPIRVPAAVWVAYLVGVNPAHRAVAEESLRAGATFHPFGEREAREAVTLHRELLELGRPMKWQDLQVASTARVLGEILLTNDKAFGKVPGLRVQPF